MTLIMWDSVYAADIPLTASPNALAGYVGGKYPSYKDLVAKFPHIPVLGIAVNSTQDAQCLDVEQYDATPAAVPGWLDRQTSLKPGVTHVIYASASVVPAVRSAAGSRKYLIWSAHYGWSGAPGGAHICGPCGYQPAHATQWWDHGPNGENVDQTLMTQEFFDAVFGTHPVVTAPPVNHNTGLATEKPWGAYPLPVTDWYGVNDQTVHSHSGLRSEDQRGIKQVQREVNTPPDGKYGPVTQASVALWQKAHGLVADGKAGVHTWNAMTTR